MRRILVVAQDDCLQQDLQANLQSLNKHWECCFVSSGSEALQAVAAGNFNVLVSNLGLPDMPGGELLERVKQDKPGIARILLADQEQLDEVIRHSGTAHQFLARPCEARTLLSSIERTCRLRSLLSSEVMRNVAGNTDTLPGLPALYLALSREINRGEDSSLKVIAGIVAQDIAMSAKVLQIANSAFFGLRRRVESAQQAVKVLGGEVIRSIVLLNTLYKAFPARTESLGQESLWQHSFAVANVAQAIAASEGGSARLQSQCYQAAVLHDIGKLMLATNFPEDYARAQRLASAEKLPLHKAEQTVFGCDHGQIGAYLLGLWGLPDTIVEAVAFHHVPVMAQLMPEELTPLVVVYAADICVQHGSANHAATGGPSASEGLASIGWFSRYDKLMQIVRSEAAVSELAH